MSVIGSNILAGASGQGGGYNLTRSLRFRSSASAYLNRTFTTTGNQKTFTQSYWVKRGTVSVTNNLAGTDANASLDYAYFRFNSTDNLMFYSGTGSTQANLVTTAVYRDPSAWYHIVVAVDTTQVTDSNRVKIYVNGSQVTAFSTATYPSQNADLKWNNNTYPTVIGTWSYVRGSDYFDGYMTEINFIDGQALTPSSFGETSSTTGVWQPKRYSGTYGTNGFYLPFTDNSALTSGSNAGLGKDFSGNGNYWNTNNISLTSGATYDSMTDVPTLTSATASNFATLNPLKKASNLTITDGNLKVATSSAGSAFGFSTISMPSGKFYCEAKAGGAANVFAGIADTNHALTDTGVQRYIYQKDGTIYSNTTALQTGLATFASGDILGIAYDASTNSLQFYKNGSTLGTAVTTSTSYEYQFCFGQYDGSWEVNFGQRPFAYTPPTGFVALNTFNLPTPTIGATASTQANKYFDVLTWSGNGSNPRSFTGLNFQPDFVWAKNRSVGYTHSLYDSVRGAGANKELVSASTGAEGGENHDQYGYLSSFDSNGFTSAAGSAGQNYYFNDATYPAYVAWNWKANGTGVTNTAGSITSTVSANTTSGFSVVTYTGTGSAATVGHGLGVAPKMIIVKNRTTAGTSWAVYTSTTGATNYLRLNSTIASTAGSGFWNNTAPTSSVFSIGTDSDVNANTNSIVAYCFAEVAGFSKFGSYTGNGSTDGTFVYTGFRPKFVMIKKTDSTGGWMMSDTVRSTFNVIDDAIEAQSSSAEFNNDSFYRFDTLSNGFKLRGTSSAINSSGGTYIYMAFAEVPAKFALGV